MSNFDSFKKKNCRKVLVANNRADSPRVVSENEALRLIKRHNMNLFEISVKNTSAVLDVFTNLASQMFYK